MLLNCGRACIPHSRPPASKPAAASWNTKCAPERAESLKWHNIWVQEGRPSNVLATIMRATCKRYHEATKRILSTQNEQRNTKIVNFM